MSTISDVTPGSVPDDLDVPEQTLEVRRDGPLSLLVGAAAGVVAVAFLLRAVGSGALLDWTFVVVTAAVATLHLAAVVDARAPLVVLDRLGARVRRGATWEGVAWSEVDHVEHLARRSTLRDGSLTVVTTDGRRLGVRLSLSTRLVGADWFEVDDALRDLSDGSVPVVGRPEPEPSEAALEAEPHDEPQDEPQDEPAVVDQLASEPTVIPSPPVDEAAAVTESEPEVDLEPVREPRPARRSEVVLDTTAVRVPDDATGANPAATAETRTIFIDGIRDALRGGGRDGAEAADQGAEPPAPVEPVVGPQLAAARERLGISVDALAERTRIRPHVIEAIEVDDFEPCGGDFYARGHLRTLARVLGVDATALLAQYDERYAHAPIDARRVFEAELAAAGPGRARDGRGLNWSVLVAAVMAVVLVWSVARLVMDGPVPLADQPVLNGSPGGRASLSGATTEVPVVLTASTGGARVVVRDARQRIVFDAQLAFMQTAELDVAPPVRIGSTDGGLEVTVDGVDEGPIGATGQDAQRTYVP
jgi:transcriptional regulator with XRE-family HTH domain